MNTPDHKPNPPANVPTSEADHQVEMTIGRLLQFGVFLSAAVVIVGGIMFLAQHGHDTSDHHRFHGEPAELTSVSGVVRDTLRLDSRGVIQAGLLLLVATPIARVIFSVYAFARQGDWLYVVVTLVVLAILLYSLLAG